MTSHAHPKNESMWKVSRCIRVTTKVVVVNTSTAGRGTRATAQSFCRADIPSRQAAAR